MNAQETAAFVDATPAVARLCHAMNARDFDGLAAQLTPDSIWTVVGRRDRFAFGGPQTKTQFIDGLKASLPGFTSFSFEVVTWAKNSHTVFVEAHVSARGPGAASYTNHYLIRFIVRDGLVAAALEHYDPFEALVYVEQLTSRSEGGQF